MSLGIHGFDKINGNIRISKYYNVIMLNHFHNPAGYPGVLLSSNRLLPDRKEGQRIWPDIGEFYSSNRLLLDRKEGQTILPDIGEFFF